MELIALFVRKLWRCEFTWRPKLFIFSILATAEGGKSFAASAAAAAAAGTLVYGQSDISRHSRTAVWARFTIFGQIRENVARNNTAFE